MYHRFMDTQKSEFFLQKYIKISESANSSILQPPSFIRPCILNRKPYFYAIFFLNAVRANVVIILSHLGSQLVKRC